MLPYASCCLINVVAMDVKGGGLIFEHNRLENNIIAEVQVH